MFCTQSTSTVIPGWAFQQNDNNNKKNKKLTKAAHTASIIYAQEEHIIYSAYFSSYLSWRDNTHIDLHARNPQHLSECGRCHHSGYLPCPGRGRSSLWCSSTSWCLSCQKWLKMKYFQCYCHPTICLPYHVTDWYFGSFKNIRWSSYFSSDFQIINLCLMFCLLL